MADPTPLDINDFVYNTGTLTIAPGDTTAVFDGATTTAGTEDGDWLFAGGAVGVIQSYTDGQHAELFTPWAGAEVTDGPYIILKASLLRWHSALASVRAMQVIAMLDGLSVIYAVTGAAPDPSIGEDGNYALKTNSGAWQLWLKTGGVWDLQSTPVGATWRGVWSSVAEYVVNDTVNRGGSTYISLTTNTNAVPESSPSDWALSSAKGDPGRDGGVIAIPYTFSSTTSNTDPGDGMLRLGPGASQKEAVVIRVDPIDVDGKTWAGTYSDLAASTSTRKCAFRLYKKLDQTARIVGNVTAFATPTGYLNLTIAATDGDDNPFTNGDAVILVLDRTGDKGDTGAIGPKGMVQKGTWASVTAYAVDDVVLRSGSSYIAIQSGANKDPLSEPTYWSLVAQKGDTGATGATGAKGDKGDTGTTGATGQSILWKGAYSSGTTYNPGEIVSFSGKDYINKLAGTNQQPNTATTYWDLLFDPNASADQIIDQPKSSNYSASSGDRATLLRFTASATLSPTAAATLTNGWYCYVKADGGNVTIDPDGSEQIDGSTTLVLTNGSACILICTGSGFVTFRTSSGGGTLASIPEDIKTADYPVVLADAGKRITMNSTSAHTIGLLTAATAGAGFAFWVRNVNTGTLTIDGDSTELIDGDETFVLDKDEEALLSCTGTGWRKHVYRSEGHLEPETDVATASTMDIGATNTERVRATGTTTVTSFGTRARKVRRIRFTGQTIVQHNGTSLFLPGEGNLTFDANDIIEAVSDASGNWRVVDIQKNLAPARGRLTSDRTYYVRNDGSDNNNGLSNTSGGAYETLQKVYDVAATLDLNGFTVTAKLADGTYAGLNQTVSLVGGNFSIVGNTTTPANVIISSSTAPAIGLISPINITLSGLTLTTSGSTNNRGISAAGAGVNVFIGPSMVFGACSGAHIFSNRNALVSIDNDYTITGGARAHYSMGQGGVISGSGRVVTITQSMTFTDAFATGSLASIGQLSGFTYSVTGTVTATKYTLTTNAVINSGGGTLPGGTSGTTSSGGQYI